MLDVLVVDDNAINRQLAKTLLARDGWSPTEADCGEIALELLDTRRFPVILLDISMPGLSGIETMKHIRKRPALSGVVVIAYTAHAMEDEKRQILEAGFDDILVKPMSKATLLATFGPLKARLSQAPQETAP